MIRTNISFWLLLAKPRKLWMHCSLLQQAAVHLPGQRGSVMRRNPWFRAYTVVPLNTPVLMNTQYLRRASPWAGTPPAWRRRARSGARRGRSREGAPPDSRCSPRASGPLEAGIYRQTDRQTDRQTQEINISIRIASISSWRNWLWDPQSQYLWGVNNTH